MLNLRLRVVAWLIVGSTTVWSGSASCAIAQRAISASRSSASRDQLYSEVAAEYAAVARHGNLLKKVVRLATPTVVHIDAQKPQPENSRFRRKPVEEAGSGVIVDIEGKRYIITNRHVVDGSPTSMIRIKLADGRQVNPTNVWSDRTTDVAVMSMRQQDVVVARIGDSSDLEIGDFVLAVGSPFGLSHSITYGIISGKGRRNLQLGDGSIRYQDFLQTDAAINPGNSGGPLLNLRGEVIGINTAIASSSGGSEGIGFTIPMNMAITVARQLVQHGRTQRAYLGVQLNDGFGPELAARLGLARPQGALVKSLTPNSPASLAKLRPQDVILEFDGYRIEDDDHLIKVVGFTPVGKRVDVVVFRGGETLKVSVKVDEREKFEPES